jgi:hypothetical protein
MTLTLEQVVKATEIVNRLAQHRFPAGKIKTAYGISKLKKSLVIEATFFQEERKRLIQSLGESRPATDEEKRLGSDPIVYEVPRNSPAWPVFVDRLNEVLQLAVEIPGSPFTLDDLSTIELSADDLDALDPFCTTDAVDHTAVKESIDG